MLLQHGNFKYRLIRYSHCLFLLLLNSCILAKHTFKDGQKIAVNPGATLIVLPIKSGSDEDIGGIYSKLSEQLETKCQHVFYFWELEYDMRVHGLDPEKIVSLDSVELVRFSLWKPNSHLILFKNKLNQKIGAQGRTKLDLRYPTEGLPPIRRTIWETTIFDSDPNFYWTFQTYVDAGGIESRGKGYNIYKTAYFIGLRKASKHLKKKVYLRCN